MELLNTIIAEGQTAGPPTNGLDSATRALLLVLEAALGAAPAPTALDRTAILLALPQASTRLQALWADPDRRRLVCQGALQLLGSACQLRDAGELSEGEAGLVAAALAKAGGA